MIVSIISYEIINLTSNWRITTINTIDSESKSKSVESNI